MSKTNLIKRIETLEKPSYQPRWKVAIYEEQTGCYTGPDFAGSLTPEQFKKWYAAQDKDTQVIIVEILENKPKLEIRNYAAKNTEDLLKEYEELLEKENGEKPCQEPST